MIQETSWPGPPMKDCRTEETDTASQEADWNQGMFDATPSSFIVVKKKPGRGVHVWERM